MKTLRILLYIVILLVAAGQLTGSWLDYKWMEYTFKPLILLWVIVYYLLYNQKAAFSSTLLLAFIFSWFGDLVLMFAWKDDLYFFMGVGGFFISQIFFALAFYRSTKPGPGMIRRKPWFTLPFVAYLVTVFILIYPGLEGLMIPVVAIYAFSLVIMSLTAFNRLGIAPIKSFTLVFLGSVFFVISDSLLAFNRFLDPLPHGGFIVMTTYILAQFLIVEGMVRDGK